MAKFVPFRARRVRMQILNYGARNPAAGRGRQRTTFTVIVDAYSYSIAFVFSPSLRLTSHLLRFQKCTHRFDRCIRALENSRTPASALSHSSSVLEIKAHDAMKFALHFSTSRRIECSRMSSIAANG